MNTWMPNGATLPADINTYFSGRSSLGGKMWEKN